MSTAIQVESDVGRQARAPSTARVVTEGKFLRVPPTPRVDTGAAAAGDAGAQGAEAVAGERFLVKGVTYGTFAPDAQGYQFPPPRQIAEDFRLMASLGLNTVRL